MEIYVYTDGSAVVSGKYKGRGGFGTFFPNLFNKPKALSSGYKNTKTGRMEIMALYYAIKQIPIDKNIILKVYSDSEYVIKSFTEGRLKRWFKNNWVSYGKPVKNIDLWKKVLFEINKRPKMSLELHHIKSHQVDKEKDTENKKQLLKNPHIYGNTVADKLADYKRFNENDLKTDL